MARSNPTKDPEFKRVLGNLLKGPPKHQKDMKVGRKAEPKRVRRKSPKEASSIKDRRKP